jgi:hypothetical protein
MSFSFDLFKTDVDKLRIKHGMLLKKRELKENLKVLKMFL